MLSWPEQARLARTPQALKARGSLNGNCLAPSLLPRVEKTPKLGESKDGSSEFMKPRTGFENRKQTLRARAEDPTIT